MQFFILVLLCMPVRAQVASSSLAGKVTDSSNAPVAGAHVSLRQDTTGFSRIAMSSVTGDYRMDQLLPGDYTITVSGTGFRTVRVSGIHLAVGQVGKLDFQMEPGTEREAVTITAQLSALSLADLAAGYRMGGASLQSLPLVDRNVIGLFSLGPGAIPRHLGGFTHDVINDVQPDRGAVALNPPVNGARSTMNSFVLDGALNTDRNTFASSVKPPLGAVQEYRMYTSLAPAEFPQAGGGVIDVVTRAGTQTFHGSAFELFRNEGMDARNYFDDPVLPRPVFRRNQFGGSLGGPLPFNRTVFFVSYEGIRGESAKSSLNLVPDASLRGGDFAGRNPIFDPLSVAGSSRQPFGANRIPQNRIDSIAATFLERYQPLPNRQSETNNFLDATPNRSTDDDLSARVDHELGAAGRLFGRYTLNEERGRIANAFPVLPARQETRAQQGALGYTTAAGNWFNEARLSYTRLRIFHVPENAFRTDVAGELGIKGVSGDPSTWGLPFFLVTNFNLRTDDPVLPLTQRDNLWQLSDSFSFVHGRHTVKTGLLYTHFGMNYRQSRLARGQYIFTGGLTSQLPITQETGDAFADFLLGFPQVTNRNVGPTMAYLHQYNVAAYVQDEWRLTNALTVNAGMRYEYASPYCEQRDNLLNLDYSPLPETPSLERTSCPVEPDHNNFAPRAGVAWHLPIAVFRAGYGIYFSPEIATETYDLIRNGVRNESNPTDGTAPVLTIRDGFPQTAVSGFPGYFGIDAKSRTPYMQQWSAGIQRELPGNTLVDVSYIGTKGTHLGRFRNFNTPLHVVTGENLDPRPGDLQSLRPFPDLGGIIQRQHIANSIYHSLQIKAERRFTSRLSFVASFVWSKSIDDADSVLPGQFESFGAQDERNLRLERGLSFFHTGRRISGAYLWRLPDVERARLLLDGWEMSGLVTLQDGTPLNPVYFAFDPANTGTPNRPDVVPGVDMLLPRSQRTVERFFNTDAFGAPQPFTFGNAGRNILPGPGNVVFDLALHKRFVLHEAYSIEFRAEGFNIFNHPNFGIPGPYPDFGPFFGRIFATGDPRRIQLGLRFDF